MKTNSCCTTPSAGSSTNGRLLKVGLGLVIFTIIYNIIEAVVAVVSGYKADSIALVGFGFDSIIEVSAALLLLWRLCVQIKNKDDSVVENAETVVHRFVGVTFFALAIYIGVDAGLVLFHRELPQQSLIGILLAMASLIIMPALAFGKIKVARQIKSAALEAEAKETIACSILSLILLIGLSANALWGWWWADPAAGLCMIPWLVKEGISGLKGEGCCG